jgi:Fur family ferric uptake transcriptional regulator
MEFDQHKAFEQFLQKAGQKYTSQRKIIVEAVFNIHDHFEIEGFISTLRLNKIKVARATVYSTIKLLIEAKLIRKVRMGKGDIVYEHIFTNSQGRQKDINDLYELLSHVSTGKLAYANVAVKL